ncbi:hypothetical protein GALL_493380 [mine drainage metagenome]|uniref:Uncharacterized protein n=1 Tax=mine drainage metagenome TaxID=410659 RepID=A0A1J5PMS1_9ZZZZ
MPSRTVKVAIPPASVIPLSVVMIELPDPAASVTVLPGTTLPEELLSVTAMIEVETLSAATAVGLATTVELTALTGGITVRVADAAEPLGALADVMAPVLLR